MFKSQKFLIGLFAILFIVFTSELVYLFYYLPSKSRSNSQNNLQKIVIPTQSVEPNNPSQQSFLFDDRSASISGDLVKQIIDESKKIKLVPTSHLDILIAAANASNSLTGKKPTKILTENNFQLDNPRDNWKAADDVSSPIIFPDAILMKVLFSSEASPSGIILSGNSSKDAIKRNIFFGIGENGKRLYVEVKTERPNQNVVFNKTYVASDKTYRTYVVLDKTFNKKLDGIYILFNKKGTSFLVTDLLYNRIININVKNQINSKLVAEGLFPRDLFYLGYVISPKSNLNISELSFLLTK